MPKKTEAKRLEAADPTLPTTTITFGGTEYRLCFDLGALAEAEREINLGLPRGEGIDILEMLPQMTSYNCRVLFAVALRRFHPEIAFEQAKALLNLPGLYVVRGEIANLWVASMPKAADDPTGASAAGTSPETVG